MNKIVIIDQDECIACEACVDLCLQSILYIDPDTNACAVTDENLCDKLLGCEDICPMGAIKVKLSLTKMQRRKLHCMFQVYDLDGNGYLEKPDFERLAKSLAELRGWKPGDPGYARLQAVFVENIWGHLLEYGDKKKDQRIMMKEWLAYHDNMLASEERYQSDVAPRVAMILEALDTNDDGRYTLDDFERFYAAYGIDTSEAASAFQQLDRNGDGQLSRDELEPLWSEFYFSEDPAAPGNYIFGTF